MGPQGHWRTILCSCLVFSQRSCEANDTESLLVVLIVHVYAETDYSTDYKLCRWVHANRNTHTDTPTRPCFKCTCFLYPMVIIPWYFVTVIVIKIISIINMFNIILWYHSRCSNPLMTPHGCLRWRMSHHSPKEMGYLGTALGSHNLIFRGYIPIFIGLKTLIYHDFGVQRCITIVFTCIWTIYSNLSQPQPRNMTCKIQFRKVQVSWIFVRISGQWTCVYRLSMSSDKHFGANGSLCDCRNSETVA